MYRITLLLLIAFFFTACDTRQREELLNKKEIELNEKEQQLLLKERSLEVREQIVMEKERKLDSTLLDSIVAYNAVLPGQWAVKMVCTETTCTGSAVGDTKNETWTFSYENNRIVARAMAGDKLARTYSGTFVNEAIELVDNIEASSNTPATKIVVRLTITNNNTMSGIREIVRPDCKIVYSLQLNK